MRDSFICPHCGGFMEYDSSDGSYYICDTCCYLIRADSSEDLGMTETKDE